MVQVKAVGSTVLTVALPQYGRHVMLVDPIGLYIKSDAMYRVFSKARLKEMGLVLSATGEGEKLVCVRMKREVPVLVRGGTRTISINGYSASDVVKKETRNYKRNIGLKHAIDAMKRGGQSPLYINDDSHVVSRGDMALMTAERLVEDMYRETEGYSKSQLCAFEGEMRCRNDADALNIGVLRAVLVSNSFVMNIARLTPQSSVHGSCTGG